MGGFLLPTPSTQPCRPTALSDCGPCLRPLVRGRHNLPHKPLLPVVSVNMEDWPCRCNTQPCSQSLDPSTSQNLEASLCPWIGPKISSPPPAGGPGSDESTSDVSLMPSAGCSPLCRPPSDGGLESTVAANCVSFVCSSICRMWLGMSCCPLLDAHDLTSGLQGQIHHLHGAAAAAEAARR